VLVGAAELRADRAGDAEAHHGLLGRGDAAARPGDLQVRAVVRPQVLPAVLVDHHEALVEHAVKRVHDLLRVQLAGRLALCGDPRLLVRPEGGERLRPGPSRNGCDGCAERLEHEPGVAGDPDVGADAAAELVRVDVHLDCGGVLRQVAAEAGLELLEPGADVDGAGAPVAGQVERALHRPARPLGHVEADGPLRDRLGELQRGRVLEDARPLEGRGRGGDEADDRAAGVGGLEQAGDEVGHPRARAGVEDADSPGDAGVGHREEDRRGLHADEHRLDRRELPEVVVEVRGVAGDAEDVLDLLARKRLGDRAPGRAHAACGVLLALARRAHCSSFASRVTRRRTTPSRRRRAPWRP
jgi:hypothetical protein